VANFSLAVDRPKRNGEKVDPLWVKVTLWGKQAEALSKFIVKGKQLVVSGEADLSTFETRDGNSRTDLTLTARNVTLFGGGEQAASANGAAEAATGRDEDIPF
jgi:single-strand DNA-binding protein